MVKFNTSKKEITLEEIQNITTPLFKKYGFKSAYLFGYYSSNTTIIDIDIEFMVEDSDKTEELDMLDWYDMIDDFEHKLQLPCQITDMDILKSDNHNYLKKKYYDKSILIYKEIEVAQQRACNKSYI